MLALVTLAWTLAEDPPAAPAPEPVAPAADAQATAEVATVPEVLPTELTPKRRVVPTRPRGVGNATCKCKLWIGEDGKPYQVAALSCDSAVADASVAALEKWTFKPYLVDGEPSKVSTVITVEFKIH